MNYRVRWEIDVEADNEVEAARTAKKIQLDPESTANVFSVHLPRGAGLMDIDLDCKEEES